jgi:hypothetical protein
MLFFIFFYIFLHFSQNCVLKVRYISEIKIQIGLESVAEIIAFRCHTF